MASVMQRKRSAQTPVSLVRSLSGLALSCPVSAAQTSHPAGPRAPMNASGFKTNRTNFSDTSSSSRLEACERLVVLLQVHARVESLDLFGVAVEHQRLALEEFADATLHRLTPSRVIDARVHVRVEPIL